MNKVKKWIPPVIPIHNDLPTWKALFNDVHDNLIEAGFVQTEDIGQLDIDAVDTLPADTTYAGYRCYYLNDSFQSTMPIFLKIEFGCGRQGLSTSSSGGAASVSRYPALRFTFGTGSDGNGSIVSPSHSFVSPQEFPGSGSFLSNMNTEYGLSCFSVNDDQGFVGFFYGLGSRVARGVAYVSATLAFMVQRDIDENGNPLDTGFTVLGPGYDQNVSASAGFPITGLSGIMNHVPSGFITRRGSLRPFGTDDINTNDDLFFAPVYLRTASGDIRQWPSVVSYRSTDMVVGSEFQLEMQQFSPRSFCAVGSDHSIDVDELVGYTAGFAILFEGD